MLASLATALLLAGGVALAITRDCRAGADYCIGTADNDTLNGSPERDKIYGKGGNDALRGYGEEDVLSGGNGDDMVRGGAEDDRMPSTPGVDKLYGGPGNDRIEDHSYDNSDNHDPNLLSGGSGDDYLYGYNKLYGGSGDDVIHGSSTEAGFRRIIVGGPGEDDIRSYVYTSDTIRAADDERDTVNCGGGTDTIYFDRGLDEVNPLSCENRHPQ